MEKRQFPKKKFANATIGAKNKHEEAILKDLGIMPEDIQAMALDLRFRVLNLVSAQQSSVREKQLEVKETMLSLQN